MENPPIPLILEQNQLPDKARTELPTPGPISLSIAPVHNATTSPPPLREAHLGRPSYAPGRYFEGHPR